MDLMLDLETLGVSAQAPIISIGAALFDRASGATYSTFHERCTPSLELYKPDLSTIQWWLAQSEAARASLTQNIKPLAAALAEFRAFVRDGTVGAKECSVWALPASFDLPILENAFRVEFKEAPPWTYNAPRDLRTVFDLAKIDKADRVQPKLAHDALSDCEAQIATLVVALKRLGLQ